MTRLHDDEIIMSSETVRALLADQCLVWADAEVTPLATSGTSNTTWRLKVEADDLLVRIPRTERAARGIEWETELLPRLASSAIADLVEVPNIRHVGRPTPEFPHPWLVVDWIPGVDGWAGAHDSGHDQLRLADELAAVVHAVRSTAIDEAPRRSIGSRGGPLEPVLRRLEGWLDDPAWGADRLVDVEAIRRCADACAEAQDEPIELGFVHGDLIPGNLVLVEDRLTGLIDWSTSGRADLAQDLSAAWAIFDLPARKVFQAHFDVSEATWLRAKAFELEHAVGAILYYRPRANPLADVMERTLVRVLGE